MEVIMQERHFQSSKCPKNDPFIQNGDIFQSLSLFFYMLRHKWHLGGGIGSCKNQRLKYLGILDYIDSIFGGGTLTGVFFGTCSGPVPLYPAECQNLALCLLLG